MSLVGFSLRERGHRINPRIKILFDTVCYRFGRMFMFVYVYVTSFPDSCFYMIRFHVYVDVSIYVYADV